MRFNTQLSATPLKLTYKLVLSFRYFSFNIYYNLYCSPNWGIRAKVFGFFLLKTLTSLWFFRRWYRSEQISKAKKTYILFSFRFVNLFFSLFSKLNFSKNINFIIKAWFISGTYKIRSHKERQSNRPFISCAN